jgi:mRNA interferase MazF
MNIEQGEVWNVEFFPKVGGEIGKKRPSIVVSHKNIGRLLLKTIVPITHWSDNFIDYPWIIKLINNKTNGLSKVSAIDCFQIRNFSHKRFITKIGVIDKPLLFSIHETIAKTLNPAYRLSLI